MSSKRKNTPTKLAIENLDSEELSADVGSDHVTPDISILQADAWNNSGRHGDCNNKKEDDIFPLGSDSTANLPNHYDTEARNGNSGVESNPDTYGEHGGLSDPLVDSNYPDKTAEENGYRSVGKGEQIKDDSAVTVVEGRVVNNGAEDNAGDDDPEDGGASNSAGPSVSSPLSGPVNSQKKSMESVIRRLNSKASDCSSTSSANLPPETASSEQSTLTPEGGEDNPQVMDTVQAVLAGEATLSEKERQISEMINHLQNIKENLSKQKVGGRSSYLSDVSRPLLVQENIRGFSIIPSQALAGQI